MHETCKYKCRLDASVCNNKSSWNNHKCRCDPKALIDKGSFDKAFIGNSSSCKWEYGKICYIGEYLDYESYKCRKELVDKFIEECNEKFHEKKIIEHNCIQKRELLLYAYLLTQYTW